MKLAIDFGTTNTVIARWTDSAPEILNLPGLSIPAAEETPLIPSLVYVEDGQTGAVTVGYAVRQRGLDYQPTQRLFRSFKRGIVATTPSTPRQIDGAAWDERRAGDRFVQALLAALPEPLGRLERLVLTAPVTAFEGYLTWLHGVMGEVAPDRVHVVDESTAAALGYAVTEPGAPVLVVDFGGGTLDLSLVQLPDSREATGGILGRLRRGDAGRSTARVIAKAGRVLGGSDIDRWLLEWLLAQMGISRADLAEGEAALLTACEQAKIQLSTEAEAVICVTASGGPRQVVITRGTLETLLAANGFYDLLRHAVDKVMHIAHRAGVYQEDIRHVLLVGGVSLMPSVRAVLEAAFDSALVRSDKPFTAVAEGALQVAAGYGLDDYLQQGYGLRTVDPAAHQARYVEVIPMGSRYPSDSPIEVILAAADAGQSAVEFILGEIADDSGSMVEVRQEDGQAVFVTAMDAAAQAAVTPLNALHPLVAPLQPAGMTGEPRLRLRLTLDEQRRLHLTVHDLKTHRDLVTDRLISAAPDAAPLPPEQLSGREPALADSAAQHTSRRLSLRRVANLLTRTAPDAISLEAAEAALRSSAFQARQHAAELLAKRGDLGAQQVLARVLSDSSVPARASAARCLSHFSWFSAEPLLRQAADDPDSRVRESMAYALCELHDLHAYRMLAERLNHEADNVRAAAAYGLRDCPDPAAVPALQAVLLAGDPDVRVKALEALSVNNTPAAWPVVRGALADAAPDVVYAAALSLLELAGTEALPELAALIAAGAGERREALLRAIFHATNYLNIDLTTPDHLDTWLSALDTALADPAPAVRQAAIWPLAWMRHERAAVALAAAFRREADGATQIHILRVVVNLMALGAEALLVEALASADPVLHQAAAEILAERERTGVVQQYDEAAGRGTGFSKPSVAR